jgi:GNAT superfamily N-acetyltransferase
MPADDQDASIRRARADEADAVRALVQRAYAGWVAVLGRRPAPMDDDYARHIAAGEVFVLEDGGALAALVVLIEQPDHLLLDNVAVAPERHGGGGGRRMIAFAEREALRRGHREIRLFTNERMQRNLLLYGRLGFVETGRATVGGHPRVFMTKTIRPPV